MRDSSFVLTTFPSFEGVRQQEMLNSNVVGSLTLCRPLRASKSYPVNMDYRFCIYSERVGLVMLNRRHSGKLGHAGDMINVQKYLRGPRRLTE